MPTTDHETLDDWLDALSDAPGESLALLQADELAADVELPLAYLRHLLALDDVPPKLAGMGRGSTDSREVRDRYLDGLSSGILGDEFGYLDRSTLDLVEALDRDLRRVLVIVAGAIGDLHAGDLSRNESRLVAEAVASGMATATADAARLAGMLDAAIATYRAANRVEG